MRVTQSPDQDGTWAALNRSINIHEEWEMGAAGFGDTVGPPWQFVLLSKCYNSSVHL